MKNKVLIHVLYMTKKFIYILLIQCVSMSLLLAANSNAQVKSIDEVVIRIGMSDMPIEMVFSEVERRTGFNFVYTNKELESFQKITVERKRQTLYDLLVEIAVQTHLEFKQVNHNIHVKKAVKGEEVPVTIAELAEDVTITGTVVDQHGEPIPGATVSVPGTGIGTATDFDGNYSLTVPEGSTLVFSFIGFETQTVVIGGRSVIDVTLVEDMTSLEEVVVVGYGTQRKSDVTGSVVSVGSKDFVQGVTTDALQLLTGKASGVNISQANAEPGGSLNIRVRGAGSINSNNNVLVVIDGLPGGSTANINPADIESIEILKDASAAAIYGTRGANGVVLITTKKGKEGVAQVSYDTYWAIQTPAYKFDVLNATQYMQMINDISGDAGRPLPYTNEEITSAGEGTDWQDELFRSALASNHQVSISGGTNQARYYTSLGYLDQDGIMISSGFKKYNVLINLEVNPNKKFKFGINLSGNLNLTDKIANESNSGNENADPLNAALMFDPRMSPHKDVNGEYERNPSIALDNPIALAHGYDYRNENSRIYGNSFVEYEIIDGLKAMVRLGGDINNSRNDEYTDRTTQRGKANGGIGNVISSNLKYWLAEALVNYDRTFGKHTVSFVGGSTWERFENLSQRSYATGFLSDVTNTNLLQSGNVLNNQVSTSKNVYKLQSFLSRINYSFNNKFLLTATVRRDGTSRFSKENKYAIFPSLAVGWRISEEPFINSLPFISDLKLGFGYGQVGNEGIGNFETISTFVAGGNAVLGGIALSGAQPARVPNAELTWETTEGYNFSLDFGLFNNRLSGTLEYYIKNSIDQLFNRPIPMSSGFSNVRTNFGSVRNSGIDISLTSHNLTGDFQWTTNLTFSTLKNEVTELPPFVGDIVTGGIVANIPGFALVRQGYPMRAFYGYKVIGIFQQGDNIANSAQPNARPGEPIFLDYDQNGRIDANDRTILGDPFPDISYGLNNSFSYKNFNLDIYLLGVHGIKTFNANVLESMFPINFDRNIMSKHYLERWTPENPHAEYPSGVNSAVYFGGGKMINSYTVQDASFVRLRNITLGYNIPLQNVNFIKSIRLNVSADNLFTITDFEGFDPDANQTGDGSSIEKSSYNNYPLAKVFRIGANINF